MILLFFLPSCLVRVVFVDDCLSKAIMQVLTHKNTAKRDAEGEKTESVLRGRGMCFAWGNFDGQFVLI